MKNPFRTNLRTLILLAAVPFSALLHQAAWSSNTAGNNSVLVPVNRSSLVVLPAEMSEVLVSNPEIADVYAHNSKNLTVVGKKLGATNVRVFNKSGVLLRAFDVTVSYDLPAIRRTLKNFLPNETIGVELVNTNIALTGRVTSAAAADRALAIVREYIRGGGDPKVMEPIIPVDKERGEQKVADVLNFMEVATGQQVQLRVRVGEINRTALKNLGLDISGGTGNFSFGTGHGLAGIVTPIGASALQAATRGPGKFILPTDSNGMPIDMHGALFGRVKRGSVLLGTELKALERDGLFKLLAEPNLVAISGEQAEFLAGGEIPIPVPQGGSSGSGSTVTIDYKPYGVAVKFKPLVLGENRIRMEVMPEVSELDFANAVDVSGFKVPAITTRRASTTVELAAGEGFMIAGLIRDQTKASIDQLPGLKDLPVLGALFRSTEFQRDETELVIAVTPYVVDPVRGGDVRLPTDNFKPASQIDMFFFGALGNDPNRPGTTSAKPEKDMSVEGPTGFMMD